MRGKTRVADAAFLLNYTPAPAFCQAQKSALRADFCVWKGRSLASACQAGPRPRLAAPVNGLQSLYRSQAQSRRVADHAEANGVDAGIRTVVASVSNRTDGIGLAPAAATEKFSNVITLLKNDIIFTVLSYIVNYGNEFLRD